MAVDVENVIGSSWGRGESVEELFGAVRVVVPDDDGFGEEEVGVAILNGDCASGSVGDVRGIGVTAQGVVREWGAWCQLSNWTGVGWESGIGNQYPETSSCCGWYEPSKLVGCPGYRFLLSVKAEIGEGGEGVLGTLEGPGIVFLGSPMHIGNSSEELVELSGFHVERDRSSYRFCVGDDIVEREGSGSLGWGILLYPEESLDTFPVS
ncbi:hypothetical protein EV421DRAFT_1745424 [Armillaria borealis]|uniref:Uncharacterized protein n=1 Tax=Armillaria borealis TaxID=47425 RepID=A0AA39MDI8_9AGAR|nr:hypothetical protein EV421DRAFT_1745424 [Armillaria borealis]